MLTGRPVSIVLRRDFEAAQVRRKKNDAAAPRQRSFDQMPAGDLGHPAGDRFMRTQPDRRQLQQTLACFGDRLAQKRSFGKTRRTQIGRQTTAIARRSEIDKLSAERTQTVQNGKGQKRKQTCQA